MEYELLENEVEETAPSHGRDLTKGSIPRHLINLSIPLLAGGMVQVVYGLVNGYWVGNYLGTTATAAVALGMRIFLIMTAAAVGMTTSANILIAQAYGAKDWPHLRRVIQNSVVLTLSVSLLCSIACLLVMKNILLIIGAKPDVLKAAVSYMNIFVWATPILFLTFLVVAFLRAVGDAITPMYFQIASLIVNAVLDPLLIRGLYGFPKMGLNGTAVATMTAQMLALVAIIIYLQRSKHLVAPDWKHLGVDRATTWLMLRIGIPTMIQQSLVFIGISAILSFINKFGNASTAGWGLATRLDQFAIFAAMMVGTAVSTVAGQNLGLKQYDRVKQVLRWGLVLACGLTTIPFMIAMIIPKPFMHAFIKDPATISAGVSYLRIVGYIYLMFGVVLVCNGVINAAGHTAVTTAIAIFYLWAIQIPLAILFTSRTHKLEGIWYAITISYGLSMVLTIIYYLSGRWKRDVIHRTPAPLPTEG